MNRKLGRIGALVTGAAVLAFALSMVVGFFTPMLFASCLSSMLIAIGYVTFTVALAGINQEAERRGVSYAAVAFSVIYAVLVLLVYYAQCTTLNLNPSMSAEALSLISYGQAGSLFFNYDLLGYGFMGLSTFFAGFVVKPVTGRARALRIMLWIHGAFFPICFIMPMLPVFTGGGDSSYGTYLLEGWCAYFLPLCLLAYDYFRRPATA